MSYTDKHEFSSIWKWISCWNDIINHVDCAIKRDVYPQKMHLCSKNISVISVFVLKISVVYKKNISWVILHGYSCSWKINVFHFPFLYSRCVARPYLPWSWCTGWNIAPSSTMNLAEFNCMNSWTCCCGRMVLFDPFPNRELFINCTTLKPFENILGKENRACFSMFSVFNNNF